MTNSEIAKLLNNVASAYAITDEKKYRFQILAYRKAADAVEGTSTELKELQNEGKLEDIPGVGPSIKLSIDELLQNGKVKHLDDILGKIPSSVYPLLDVPSIGPKTAYKLVSKFKLENPETVIAELLKIAASGKIAILPGFGEKSEKDIIRAFEEFKLGKGKTTRMVLPYASELAQKMIDYLKSSKSVVTASPLGSLRRKKSTVGDIDIAASSYDPQSAIDHFTNYPHVERIIEKGKRTAAIMTSGGRQIDLMVESPSGFGALLQHFTGSKDHNVHLREIALSKGYSLSDYGMKKKGDPDSKVKQFKTEEELYKALGLAWIPPEIRENTGEIELASQNKLPKLVELSDIKGDFHIHSSYPIEPSHDMGISSMEEMLNYALKLNYKYLGFSEHNPSISKHTSDQTYKILENRSNFIEQLKLKYNKSIHIFSLMETDILPNGKLALDDKALSLLDGSIVSIHSSFDTERSKMTERVLKGLSHPKALILAHPTGRLLNQRPGYDLDWNQVFDFCVKNNKAIEINSWPLRLDLPDNLVREAVKKGAKLVIDTDSHALDHMNLMKHGVSVARRGWATPSDILNTFDYNKLKEWIERR
ncbi:MAG TPA: helix-hairpin-helix domain-containing protein [Candidatus Limnocylindrales bacterium]|nr:helix-hairpin-helix domain-containing protein [Candidatus Limnocylindrales bacterium]